MKSDDFCAAIRQSSEDVLKDRDARIAALVESLKELLPHAAHAIGLSRMASNSTGALDLKMAEMTMIDRAETLIAENTEAKP